MSGFFFSGSSIAKLDEKSRFVLPQSMRYGLVESGKCEFVLGLGLGGCLAIYRRSTIQGIVEKFREKQHLSQYQKFFTLFFSTLHETECDKVGRVMIPGHLKGVMNIKKEIVVAGVMDKIEIWPREEYEKNLRQLVENREGDQDLIRMMGEAFSLLVEKPITP